jgi:glutamine cyclotransferase
VTKILEVAENNRILENLNELEYIKGFIYANIWMTNTIVKIDPTTGDVVGKMDLSDLAYQSKTKNPNALEMNGIAYDSISNKIMVTGKLWPTIYEIKFPL